MLKPHWLVAGLLLCSANSWALPTGEQVVVGQADVSIPNAGQRQINQASQKAAINWQGFSINPNEAVNIQQPNAQAALLNRVVGQDASQIQGQLNANGQVYLVNPNGVVFSKTAQVDVGGLVATTHEISNQDFINGNNHFTQNGATGSVENHGTITTPAGGVVALIGEHVTNTGNINTPKGTTALAAGKTVDLDFQGDGLVEVKVTEAALNAQINNQGAIQADGGRVVMSAKAANQLIDTVINQDGIVKARGLIERNGEIILDGGDNGAVKVSGTLSTDGQNTGGAINVTGKAVQLNNAATVTASGDAGGGIINIGNQQTTGETRIAENASVNAIALDHGNAGSIKVLANMNNGTVNVAGKLNATAPKTGNGGRIETSAAKINIADSAKISTHANNGNSGTWLIDPYDFTIAATGGDITGIALSTALTKGNVKIQTGAASATCTGAICGAGNSAGNGDIFVKDVITWAINKLTLSAYRNINIDSNLNGSGFAQLALEYGQGALAAGNTSDYFVRAAVNLPEGNNNFSTKLGSDGAVTNYTVITDLGVVNDASTTSLQGIKNNLTGNYALGGNIDATPAKNWASATGKGFEPIGIDTFPNTNAGAFSGQFHGLGHTISSLFINSNRVTGVGLFGSMNNGMVRDVGLINATVIGSASDAVGGLVGISNSDISSTISNVYVTGNVMGNNLVGGLVGWNSCSINNACIISNAYATVNVIGNHEVGGLVGWNGGSIDNAYIISNTYIISNAYAIGNVTGNDDVGGLVGLNVGSISNAYATGSVSGDFNVGGLVGSNLGTISTAYATGNVTGNYYVGGLGGWNSGTISNAYGTSNVTGNYYVGGLVGWNNSIISNAYATGNVSGTNYVGGLVGKNNSRTVSNAYATGSVSGNTYVGGLVGFNDFGTVSNVYATGNVSGNTHVGGLVGFNGFFSTVSNAYATGNVSGTTFVGGLVGFNYRSGGGSVSIINNAYATGNVSGNDGIGGLVGVNYGAISNAYATGSVSGTSYVGGLAGRNGDEQEMYLYMCCRRGFYGTINNAYATGNVSGTTFVGGLVGFNNRLSTINNSHYNIDRVLINSSRFVTQGGIYDTQYQDWISHNKTLNISDYAATLTLDTNGYYSINSLQSLKDLLGFADNPTYKFRLNTDINLAAASGLFIPDLAGEFDGAGHTFSNLELNQSFTGSLGMFGLVRETGAVKNLGLINVKIVGSDYVGGLIGLNSGDISNAYATGSVSGANSVGGLIGFSRLFTTISNVYATSSVSGANFVGGLVGYNDYGTISNVYATGSVSGTNSVGGLVGYNYGAINNAFWNTETTGKDINNGIGFIDFYNINRLNNVSGKTTAEMTQLATFSNAGWDIANTGGSSAIWRIYEGQTTPLLRSFLTPLTITADNITKTYNGLSDSVLSNASYSIANATTSGHLFNQDDPYNGAKNAGSYTAKMLYSDQQGYDISYVDGVLTINKANLLITANDANKIYDGLGYYGGNGVRYLGFVNGETEAVLFGKLRYGGSSQGAINVGFYWISPSGFDADNYQISYQDGRLTIEPAPQRFNLEDQIVPLQVATTFLGNQKTQPVKQDDSESTVVIEKGGIKLPADIPFREWD